jgi:hypothetical protein
MTPRSGARIRFCAATLIVLAFLPFTAPFATWDLAPPPDATVPGAAKAHDPKPSSDVCLTALAGLPGAARPDRRPARTGYCVNHAAPPLTRLTVLRI